ncbi:hypothetical protein GCM10011515_00680 [Tsuneonella deserti]|uniref:Uncharacterized protein n=1 Tax=Tsuneonella deserti TaxID=2035528 RepID=A0ABQ1RY83_9SPHN|nr:hypothetical protein GCM10011515_00680 [Tsuneonella deserti]
MAADPPQNAAVRFRTPRACSDNAIIQNLYARLEPSTSPWQPAPASDPDGNLVDRPAGGHRQSQASISGKRWFQ